MQKYISKTDETDIRYFEDDVNVEDWIDLTQYRLMTEDEIDKHENPEKYLSDVEKAQLSRERMPTLSPIEFDLKLDANGLYDAAQTLIAGNRTLMIAYTRATYFSRTDSFIEQARLALNLTHEQIDEMWTS